VRFIRDYKLTILIKGGEVTIVPPMAISFNVDKSISGQLNKADISIKNIAEKTRLQLTKDAEENKVIKISLYIGYDGKTDLIYKGTVFTGANERSGPDIVTKLSSLDGGLSGLYSFTNATVEGGSAAINQALGDMGDIGEGKIAARPTLVRPKVLVGNSLHVIDDMVGHDETWYIDNEQLFILKKDEIVSRFVPVASPETGLISTPTRESKIVTFETKINPAIRVGGGVKLISTTAPHLNGVYKIDTISYAGDNYGDDWTQTCSGRLYDPA
jgi:hypothetical protein